ncbi:MAG TPA: M23 family metallopeptidase [Longimicrobiales bacterium]|nr:M23 family metallopeptidase [Longimicrobiales bacterium]
MMDPRSRATAFAPFAVAGGLVLLTACEEIEQIRDGFRDMTPHEAYQESLAAAGLDETALGNAWLVASQAAVTAPTRVALPFQEEGYITVEQPGAMAYLVTVPRGRRLTAEVTLQSEDGTRVFVDLFRVAADEGDPLRPIVSTDSVPGTFIHEPWRGGDFILRLQPELLRGGQYRVTLRLEAQLAFPVDGYSMRAIQSMFGADRDGGRRSHDGVDIFARRGTPVLAAAPGLAYRIGITNLGGKVVWVRDPLRNFRLYYAHLDSQHVREGDRIEIGDTLGFVGNTGNARTTPPHLHFGIYRSGEGAVDPVPFLDPPRGTLAELTADLDRLGAWVRLSSDRIRLRAGPGEDTPILRELPEHTALRVLGGSGSYFRVRLPDGTAGYVASRLTEPVDDPVASQLAMSGASVHVRPDLGAPLVATIESDAELPVFGRYEGYLYVRAPSGRLGWIDAPDEEQPSVATGARDTQE